MARESKALKDYKAAARELAAMGEDTEDLAYALTVDDVSRCVRRLSKSEKEIARRWTKRVLKITV